MQKKKGKAKSGRINEAKNKNSLTVTGQKREERNDKGKGHSQIYRSRWNEVRDLRKGISKNQKEKKKNQKKPQITKR